ncbi:seryl-tRNA synthetase, partial [Piedraia hortae CBS 480.64]
TQPTTAPKPVLDLKHIRLNPGLYEQNAVDRNFNSVAQNGWKLLDLHNELVQSQRLAVEKRRRNNELIRTIKEKGGRDGLLVEEAKELKAQLAQFESREKSLQSEMLRLGLELPNLSSLHTPVGEEPRLRGYINGEGPMEVNGGDHAKSSLLDFSRSAVTSGWGFYFLEGEAALLEQALVQYALAVAMKYGWKPVTPPSLVYAHIAHACGFRPRDEDAGQIYAVEHGDKAKPQLVLAGTAEIPFAGSRANSALGARELPLKLVGPSRCYRAEAGARGAGTRGLYRVHEFTKVELFAWTMPPPTVGWSEGEADPATKVFDEIVTMQTEIVQSLGLHARILEQPTTDLGASAARKVDIEVYFPSRKDYGEVTSTSICTDYQSRRLNTRLEGQKSAFVHTVNGTAMAVPRIIAALLEYGFAQGKVPECLKRYLP